MRIKVLIQTIIEAIKKHIITLPKISADINIFQIDGLQQLPRLVIQTRLLIGHEFWAGLKHQALFAANQINQGLKFCHINNLNILKKKINQGYT